MPPVMRPPIVFTMRTPDGALVTIVCTLRVLIRDERRADGLGMGR